MIRTFVALLALRAPAVRDEVHGTCAKCIGTEEHLSTHSAPPGKEKNTIFSEFVADDMPVLSPPPQLAILQWGW